MTGQLIVEYDSDAEMRALKRLLREGGYRARPASSARPRARVVATTKQHYASLTRRQQEVLRYVLAGCLNKVIAKALGISEKTVKIHRSRMLKKMQVGSVAELSRLCAWAGIEPLDLPDCMTRRRAG